ncbi:hypothetical protein GF319_04445 [Candidatus Bathyarchaeota archaeon]|nr:hypothetical protein [Candidatus Bathyarchaeota archaeon]
MTNNEENTPILESEVIQRNIPSIGAAVRMIIIFTSVLSIPLTAAEVLGLSELQTSSWIMSLYGISALLGLVLTVRYRQPILITGNIFFIIFISGLEAQIAYPELIGASIIAGTFVAILGLLGLTERLTSYVPVPIVYGLLAGAVLPFVTAIFTSLGDSTLIVGGTLLAYLISRRFLDNRLPAILPALIAGLICSVYAGQFKPLEGQLYLTIPELTMPVFSLKAIITAAPVFFVLITIQSNLPSIRFLQSQEYDPPELVISVISGIGTIIGSLFGPIGVSLSLPATSLVAGPGAGDKSLRHKSVYISGLVAVFIGFFASIAVGLASAIPLVLLLTLAGISVVNVLENALQQITKGPLILGPLFTFTIAISEISFLGYGPYFWALVIGTGVSLLLEKDALNKLRNQVEQS